MTHADRIREYCNDKFIIPARKSGKRKVVIRAGDVHSDLGLKNLLPGVCSALGSNVFEKYCNVKRISVEGPTNVANAIFTYDILDVKASEPRSKQSDFGHYEGEVVTLWITESGPDRVMITQKEFCYVDRKGKSWYVPANNAIDGASIPKILWSAIGGPYEGDYRRASVIHDYFCVVKTEPSKLVHNMFYEAMLCDGVEPGKAAYMYTAVRLFGPRWDKDGKSISPSPDDVDRLEQLMDQLLGD